MPKTEYNHETMKYLCERLGVDIATDFDKIERPSLRALNYLSQDVNMLEQLAKQDKVTLYELCRNNLLPPRLAIRVIKNAPRSQSECNERNAYFLKELSDLTDEDCKRFRGCDLVGATQTDQVKFLIKLHRDTDGFRTLMTDVAPLTACEQVALLNRIAKAIQTDRPMQRKLMAMFPDRTP